MFNREQHMHDHWHCAGPLWSRFPRSRFRIARMPIRAFYRAKLHPIQPPIQNGAEKNQMKTDSITIGRDPVLTYQILTGIARREKTRQIRQAKWAKITSTLKFWT